MKRRNVIPFLFSLALLASCGTTSSVTPASEKTSSQAPADSSAMISGLPDSSKSEPSNSFESSVKVTLLDEMYPLLDSLVKDQNYTLTSKDSGTQQVFNADYYYVKTTNTTRGLIQLPYINPTTLVYNYTLFDDDVSLGSPYVSSSQAYSSLEQLTGYFSGLSMAKTNFTSNDSEVITEEKSIVAAFYSLLQNSDDTTLTPVEASFSFADKDKKTIAVKFYNDKGEEISSENAVFSEIGTSTVMALENYLASYTLPTEKIPEASLSNLLATPFEGEGELSLEKRVSSTENDTTPYYKTYLGIDDSKISVKVYDAEDETEPLSSSFYTKGEDGKAYENGVNGLNEVEKDSTGMDFTRYDRRASNFKSDEFYKTGENEFTYYGLNSFNLYYALSNVMLVQSLQSFASVRMTLADNKVSTLSFYGDYFLARESENGPINTYRYVYTYKVSENPTAIADFTAYTESEHIFTMMESELTKSDRNYKVVDEDSNSSYHNEWYVTSDMIVHETVSSSSTTGEGYLLSEKGLAHFSFVGDTIKFKSAIEKDGKLDDHLPWKAKKEIFQSYGNGLAGLKNQVFAAKVLPYVFADSYVQKDGVYVSDFAMKLDSQNRLSQMSYKYSDFASAGDMKVTYTYGNGALPADLDSKIRTFVANNDFVKASSFMDCNGAYSLLKSLKFTDDEIEAIPFLQNDSYDQEWAGYADSGYAIVRIPDSSSERASAEKDKDYFTDYKALLAKKGFTGADETFNSGYYSETKFRYSYTGSDETLKEKYKYLKIAFNGDTPADGLIIYNTDPSDISSGSDSGDWGDYGY